MPPLRIITRGEWGARHDDGFHDRRLPVDECWLHHSVTIAPDLVTPWDDDYAAVRTLEDIGESRFGGGISYTYAITPAGLVFQGHSAHRSGAHTLNRNDIAVAIVWVGRYDTREPSEEQIRATAWLLVQCKRDGVLRRARIDGGHGQAPGQSTDCPGGYGRAAIARINQLAAQHERGEIDLSTTEDDDMAGEGPRILALLENLNAYLLTGGPGPDAIYAGQPVDGLSPASAVSLIHDTNRALRAVYDETGRPIGKALVELLGRRVADVDEAELAKELAARGFGKVDGAAVKAALVEVLRKGTDESKGN